MHSIRAQLLKPNKFKKSLFHYNNNVTDYKPHHDHDRMTKKHKGSQKIAILPVLKQDYKNDPFNCLATSVILQKNLTPTKDIKF